MAGRPDSETRRLDLLPQIAPLTWDELMHHAADHRALSCLPALAGLAPCDWLRRTPRNAAPGKPGGVFGRPRCSRGRSSLLLLLLVLLLFDAVAAAAFLQHGRGG